MHPAYIYAFQKCGFLLTKENMHLFSDEDIQAWEDALDEWIAEHPDEERPNGANGAA
jgi:hypothetical protein